MVLGNLSPPHPTNPSSIRIGYGGTRALEIFPAGMKRLLSRGDAASTSARSPGDAWEPRRCVPYRSGCLHWFDDILLFELYSAVPMC